LLKGLLRKHLSCGHCPPYWLSSKRFADIDRPSFATFRVGNKQLKNLDKLEFNGASSEWEDFVTLNKKYIGDSEIFDKSSQIQWMHGGESYDMVTGQFAKRLTSNNRFNAWEAKDIKELQLQTAPIQISIHTDKSVKIFNQGIRR
jgi:hypothetical protein